MTRSPLSLADLMRIALEEAHHSLPNDVPVGAVLIDEAGEIIARGHNQREKNNCLAGHAELIAISQANQTLGDWRLMNCQLIVTLEPCLMCSGAILQSRISKVVFGASDPRGEGLLSLKAYPMAEVIGGVLEEECQKILREFFQKRRSGKTPHKKD